MIRRAATYLLEVGGAFPTSLTAKDDVLALIAKLRPISPGIELVRLGAKGDGGYLLPNDLVGIKACFSPGVGNSSEFEKACADFGMRVFLADKSVDRPTVDHDEFVFTKKHIGANTSKDFTTLDAWVTTALPESQADLLLQMDIEGYEYETLLSAPGDLLRRFRIIIVEFHRLDLLWSQPFFQLSSPVFGKLLKEHICVHIHPNNCCGALAKRGLTIPRVMEFTFLRRDRLKQVSLAASFPHPLDSDNTMQPHLPLPKVWQRG